MVLKCLPVISLLLWTALTLASLANEDENSDAERLAESEDGKRERFDVGRISALLLGLVLSGIGDACLVYPQFMVFGVVSFSVAQFFYIRLFDLTPATFYKLTFSGWLLVAIFMIISIALLLSFLRLFTASKVALQTKTKVMIALYFGLVSTMFLSALVRYYFRMDMPSIVGLIGAFLFYCSDLILGASALMHLMLLQTRMLVILSYYAAQLCIVMSVFLEIT